MKGMWWREKKRTNIHFPVFVSPVIPSFRSDDLVHVCVRKDYPRECAPSSSQIKGTWSSDLAIDKWEASFLKEALSLLSSQGSIATGDGIQMAILIARKTVSENEINGAFNVAILKVVSAYVIIKSVLCSYNFATEEGCCVSWNSQCHCLLA